MLVYPPDFGQKYYAPQVQPVRGLNSWPPVHDSTFHVTETFVLRIRIRIYLLARRNLLWDILRQSSSRPVCHSRLWQGRGANQPPYALLHRSSPSYALRHRRRRVRSSVTSALDSLFIFLISIKVSNQRMHCSFSSDDSGAHGHQQ